MKKSFRTKLKEIRTKIQTGTKNVKSVDADFLVYDQKHKETDRKIKSTAIILLLTALYTSMIRLVILWNPENPEEVLVKAVAVFILLSIILIIGWTIFFAKRYLSYVMQGTHSKKKEGK